MNSQIFWVKSGGLPLAVMTRPAGDAELADDVQAWRDAGLQKIVSLLEETEAEVLGVSNEAAQCAAAGLEFANFPIRDFGVPADEGATAAFCAQLLTELRSNKAIGIHCMAGLGRSPLIAACILVLSGMAPEETCRLLTAARGLPVPHTREQYHWLLCFARNRAAVPSA